MWSDTDVTAVRGAGAKALVSLLDGSRTLPELLRDAAAAMPAEEAGRVVRRLAEANLVGYRHTAPCPAGLTGRTGTDPASALGCASPRSDREPAEAYWDRAGLDGFVAEDTVRGTPVALIAVGDVDREEVRAACRASSITAVDDEEGADAPFALVLCEDYLAPELRAVEARLRAQGRPWLLARPFAAEPWTGPVFEPGDDDAACWNCLAHRLREHRRGELTARRTLGLDDLRGAGGPGTAPRPARAPVSAPAPRPPRPPCGPWDCTAPCWRRPSGWRGCGVRNSGRCACWTASPCAPATIRYEDVRSARPAATPRSSPSGPAARWCRCPVPRPAGPAATTGRSPPSSCSPATATWSDRSPAS